MADSITEVEKRFSPIDGTTGCMMQEQSEVGPKSSSPWDLVPGQSLLTLLALVGSKQMYVEVLRESTRLTKAGFRNLLGWLQKEYLVDVVSTLSGDRVEEKVALTETGEEVLIRLLENTCELPELR